MVVSVDAGRYDYARARGVSVMKSKGSAFFGVAIALALIAGVGWIYAGRPDLVANKETSIAVVGSTTISSSLLEKGIPTELFGLARQEAKATRLLRLVTTEDKRQRLLALGVRSEDPGFEAAYQDFITNPSSGCACHTYNNFDDYLRQTYQTSDDVRAELWIKRALAVWCEQAWDKKYPGESGRQAALLAEGPEVRAQYRYCWTLWVQSPEEDANGESHDDIWRKVADMAYQRLVQGDDWATVVGGLVPDSADKKSMLTPRVISLDDGRLSGLIPDQFEEKYAGIYQPPRQVEKGWYVSRWIHLPDDEVIKFCKKRFAQKTEIDFLDEVYQSPKVEYFGEGIAISSGSGK